MRTSILLLLTALAACGPAADPAPDTTLRDGYLEAMCRLYLEGECEENTVDSCGGSISFETISDCTGLMRFGLTGCTGYLDVLNDNPSTVQACIDHLDAVDCATDPICDAQGEHVVDGAPCAAVEALIDPLCPEDE